MYCAPHAFWQLSLSYSEGHTSPECSQLGLCCPPSIYKMHDIRTGSAAGKRNGNSSICTMQMTDCCSPSQRQSGAEAVSVPWHQAQCQCQFSSDDLCVLGFLAIDGPFLCVVFIIFIIIVVVLYFITV